MDGRWGGLKSQRDWVDDPGLQPYLHPQTKAINIQAGIPYMRDRFHLVQEAWNTGVAGIGAPQLSQLCNTLRQSHALAVFRVIPGQASHVVLVCSIGCNIVYFTNSFTGFRETNIADVAVSPLVMLHR